MKGSGNSSEIVFSEPHVHIMLAEIIGTLADRDKKCTRLSCIECAHLGAMLKMVFASDLAQRIQKCLRLLGSEFEADQRWSRHGSEPRWRPRPEGEQAARRLDRGRLQSSV